MKFLFNDFFSSLAQAASAAAARTALGLGALATKSKVGYADLAATVGGRNLVPNSSFEQALTGLASSFVDSFAVSTEQALVGSKSLKIVETTAGVDSYVAMTISARANTSYVVSAWLYVESITAGAGSNRSIMVVDSGWLTAQDNSLTSSHPTGVWTRKVIRLTTGASATTLTVRLYCPQGTVYWDCVQVEEGDMPTAWRPHPSEVTDPVLINTPQLINLKAAADDAAAATAGVPVGGMYQAAGVLRVRIS